MKFLFLKKYNKSKDELIKDVENLKLDKIFLFFLRGQKKSRGFISILKTAMKKSSSKEKKDMHKSYLNLLSKDDFKDVFLKDVKDVKIIESFFMRHHYITDSETYNILYKLNSNFKDEDLSKIAKVLAKNNKKIYPKLLEKDALKYYKKIMLSDSKSDRNYSDNYLSLISSGSLKYERFKEKFLKEKNNNKYRLLLLDYLINDNNINLVKDFEGFRYPSEISITTLLDNIDELYRMDFKKLNLDLLNERFCAFVDYCKKYKNKEIINNIEGTIIKKIKNEKLSLLLLHKISLSYDNNKVESILEDLSLGVVLDKIRISSVNKEITIKNINKYFDLLKNKIDNSELYLKKIEDFNLIGLMLKEHNIIEKNNLKKCFEKLLENNKFYNKTLNIIIDCSLSRCFIDIDNEFLMSEFMKEGKRFILKDSPIINALISSKISLNDLEIILNNQLPKYKDSEFLNDLKNIRENLREDVLMIYHNIEKENILENINEENNNDPQFNVIKKRRI